MDEMVRIAGTRCLKGILPSTMMRKAVIRDIEITRQAHTTTPRGILRVAATSEAISTTLKAIPRAVVTAVDISTTHKGILRVVAITVVIPMTHRVGSKVAPFLAAANPLAVAASSVSSRASSADANNG